MYGRIKRFIKFNDTQETTFNNPGDRLMELLLNSNDDINLGIVIDQDLKDYIEIFRKLNINPGSSKRFRNIKNHFKESPVFQQRFRSIKGEGVTSSTPVDLTNKSPVQLLYGLSLLLAAKQAGNKNTLGKASIILDHLKNTKSISDKKYNKMLSRFTN